MAATLELRLNPDWDELETVRDRTLEYLESHTISADILHAVTMITSELAENAIKYGVFLSDDRPIRINIETTPSLIMIEVTNPIDTSVMDHIKKLDRTIQWIRGYQDPFEAYVDKMKEISKKPLENQESGLGLVRVAYEGKGILDFYVTENDMLNVSSVVRKDHESGLANE